MAFFRKRKTDADGAGLGGVQPAARSQRLSVLSTIYIVVVLLCALMDPKEGARGNNTLFEGAELYAYKWRINTQARRYEKVTEWLKSQKIVLVPLTDYTFDKDEGKIPGPPAPRRYQAKVVRELTKADVKGIVFDMVFESPTDTNSDADFANALRASNRTYIGCWKTEETKKIQKPLPQFASAARIAYLLVPQPSENNDIDRVLPVVQDSEGQYIPSLSLAGAMQAAGLQNEPIRPALGGWQIGKFYLPTNADGTFNIRFWGDPADSEGVGFFPSVPYEQIYDGAANDGTYDASNFKDHIALIGDITKLGNDFRLTPRGQMAGMEIQANAMATLMVAMEKGLLPLREAPRWLNFAMIALMAGIACCLAATLKLQWAAVAMFVTLLGYGIFNLWIFTDYALYLHFAAPCAAVFLASLGVLIERNLIEERQKSWFRGLLQRYVSPQVAEYLIAHPEKLNLGGELVVATVLFADVRGFTALSSRYEAQFLIGILNEYLQAMTDVIFAYDGTLDKYMGDGIMVVFGAPQAYEDHARRAVSVAIDMQTAMDKLRVAWEERGVPQLNIGVGIATGPMIAGNTGAIQRQEFTVLGDTVNLASRIEGLNKEVGSKLLIHESTFAFVRDQVEARGPLAQHVKGHDNDVVVYEIIGWKSRPKS